MSRLKFIWDKKEEEEEKPGWLNRTRGIGELPDTTVVEEEPKPLSTKLKFTADVGIGASAVGGATLTKPEQATEPIDLGVYGKFEPEKWIPEGIPEELQSTAQNYIKSNANAWGMWFKELQATPDKMKFLKGENWSPELKSVSEEAKTLASKASQLGINPDDWIKTGVYVGFFATMAASIYPVIKGLPAEVLNKLTYKVEGKTVKGRELVKILQRVRYPEGSAGFGKPSIFDKKIFAKFVEEGGVKSLTERMKGITVTETVPRFAFGGTKLYAGLPADEIAKSIVKVGKVTAEVVKGLDPVKVSQVTQALLNTSPTLASEFLKAVEKPEGVKGLSPKAINNKVIKEYGITEVDESIGYITREGKGIDSSGIKQGGFGQGRYVDHREIAQAGLDEELSGTEAMRAFMNKTGDIRVVGAKDEVNIDIPISVGMPTTSQLNKIRQLSKDKTIFYDLTDITGNSIKSGEGTYNTLLNDLKAVIKSEQGIKEDLSTGKLPKKLDPLVEFIYKHKLSKEDFSDARYNRDNPLNPEFIKAMEKTGIGVGKIWKDFGFNSVGEFYDKVNPTFKEAEPPTPTELAGLAEEAREAKDVGEFIDNISKPTRPIREAKVGEVVIIQSDTYGEESPTQYNSGIPRDGEIVKINPKSVSIKRADGEIYKFPASAKVSVDLKELKGKDKQSVTDFYQQATAGKGEGEYLYHGTSEGAFRNIRLEGITGEKEKYFANTEEYADTYAKRKGSDRILRVKKTPDFIEDKNIPEGGDYKTLRGIPPENIEIKVGDKWIPIQEYSDIDKNIIPIKPTPPVAEKAAVPVKGEAAELTPAKATVRADLIEANIPIEFVDAQIKRGKTHKQIYNWIKGQSGLSEESNIHTTVFSENLKAIIDAKKTLTPYDKGGKKLPTSRVKPKIREITGQIPDKIEIAEREILRLVLRGEAKGARKAFSEGKKAGIFTAKEKFADVVARAEGRKAKTAEVGKVKKILQNTDLKKLRPERQKAIKAIIDEIDLTKMTEKTKRKLTSRLDFIKDNPDNQIPPEKITELERLNKKPISDYTAEDITLIKNAILHEINLNRLKNKIVFGKEIKEAEAELKIARANVLKGKKVKADDRNIIDSSVTEHESVSARVKRIFTLDSWNPELITEELDNQDHGVIMKYIFNGIDKGVSVQYKVEDDAKAWWKEKTKGIKIDNWSKSFQPKKRKIDFQTIVLSPNQEQKITKRKIKITKGERISFLLHEKNEKNYAHLAEGGFRFSDNLKKKHKLSEDDIDEIINSATPNEVKIADIMWEFFNEHIKPKLNKTSMELDGWEVATEDNYFPIRTVSLDRKRDELKAQKKFSQKTLEGQGIFKERTNAKNALIIEDAFSVMNKHLKQTAAYIGLAKPLRYAKFILEDTELQENIRSVYNKEYVKNLKDYLQKIEDDSINLSNIDQLSAELINKLDKAILGLHIFVSLKQPVSYLAAITEIDSKYLSKGAIKKSNFNEIRENSPQLARRIDGQINREMGELGNIGSTRQFFLDTSPLNSKMLIMIRATDSATIGKIWNAVKLEMRAEHPDMPAKELLPMAIEKLEEVVRRTQPTFHAKDRSKIGREKSILVRLLTKYTSQRNKHVNIMKRASLVYNRSEKTAKDKKKYLKKLAIILILNSLLIEGINESRRKVYGSKPSSAGTFAINTFLTSLGNYYVVGDLTSSLVSKLKKGTYAGYDTGNILSSYADNVINAIAETGRTIDQLRTKEEYKSGSKKGEEKWKYTLTKALDKSASTVLAFKGIPYDNLRRLMGGVWKMAVEKEEAAKPKTPTKITIPKSGKLDFTEPKIKIKSTKLKFK